MLLLVVVYAILLRYILMVLHYILMVLHMMVLYVISTPLLTSH